jgi:tetratricopeptide (TPR) repeat protein
LSAALLRPQAERLMSAGRFGEAIAVYQALLAATPADADSWYNLGWLWGQVRQPQAALDAYAQALARGVGNPAEVHLNRAVLLADAMLQPEAALIELGHALARRPGDVDALLNLGNVHEQLGRRALAAAAYERVLAAHPGHALALARLAGLAEGDAALRGRAESLCLALADSGRSTDEQADLGFALGRALDALGDHDAAFAAYAEANRSCSADARRPAYDAAAHERLVDRIIAIFDRPLASAATPEPDPGEPRRIFICGMFRSGSSLSEQILAGHPAVTPAGEFDLLPRLASSLLRRQPPVRPDVGELAAMRRAYSDAMRAVHPNALATTDKRVDNFLHLGLAKALFPHAVIVHTRRAPLDNCLSMFFLHLGDAMPWARSLAHIGHWYRQYERLMAHWQHLYGGAIHDVAYDDLVRQPEPVIRALLAHIGLPWHEACLRPHQVASQVKTPSAWQVRQPIYTHASGRSRHYAAHLGELRRALGIDP